MALSIVSSNETNQTRNVHENRANLFASQYWQSIGLLPCSLCGNVVATNGAPWSLDRSQSGGIDTGVMEASRSTHWNVEPEFCGYIEVGM